MEKKYLLKKPESMKGRKRLGHGVGSGLGKTCGRGQKGQLSRSGSGKRPWFEGGQMPIQRRVPKRGFNNKFKKVYQIVSLSQLSKLDATDINPGLMKEKFILKKIDEPVKILANGEINKAIKVEADAFSNLAKEKIEKAGGKVILREYHRVKKEKEIEKSG